MAHYDDVIMPKAVRFGSSTTPRTSTRQVFTGSGFRKVNQLWSQKLRKLRLRYVRKISDVYEILRIWEAVEGPVHSFLARDWNDWNTTAGSFEPGDESKVSATDQPLQNTADESFLGDGTTTTFQMVKRYLVGATAAHTRTIQKPENGTVKVAVDGVALSEGGSPDDFTVDYSTGIVTFANPPGAGVSPTAVNVTWGGAFRVPVHFAEDEGLIQELRSGKTTGVSGLELLEARL
ncbi:MAG: DUF2460 domain-containing protein [Kiloniellaceae bacterium]